jgi:transposase
MCRSGGRLSVEAGQEFVSCAGACTIAGMMTTHRTYKLGKSRDQASFLPPCLEDYVGQDNPVRAIDAYVDSLDLNDLGFRAVGSDGGAGQPPYDPADLLKLYLYGYLHQVRSSRRLERETRRNVELMWLLGGLTPGYRTIANFRKDNAAGLKAANHDFVRLARSLDLLGGTLVAIDGAFFHGDASKASIVTEKRLQQQMAALDRSIAEYNAALETNDKAEEAVAAAAAPGKSPPGEDIAQKLAALRQRRAAVATDLATLAESGDGQISRTDPDARLLAKHGQIVAGYNVQIAVDGKHKLIVASAVVNEGNDTGQLAAMAEAAKAAVGAEALSVVADAGYYNGATLKACEDAAITAYVPLPDRRQRLKAQGRFSVEDFPYDTAADVYRCPAGAELRPMRGQKRQASGKMAIRYATRRSVCRNCPLRGRCLAGKRERREIERWTDEAVIERHRARMRRTGEDMMRRRKALAEHPFGTLKCRAGYRHFLVRGFDKVRGEWSLMALCYNFSRVLRIIGLGPWLARLAQRATTALNRLVVALSRAYRRINRYVAALRRASRNLSECHGGAHDSAQRYGVAHPIFLPSLKAEPAADARGECGGLHPPYACYASCTCLMGSHAMAVVDDELRVQWARRARVIDASVMPAVTSTNTNALTIMIAEKVRR